MGAVGPEGYAVSIVDFPDQRCEKCGKDYQIGDWPFCPHGRVRGGVQRDEIPGGFVQEHFGDQQETFYSWSAMRKRADQLGLQPFVRKLETVNEKAMIDAQTLENARILLSRAGSAGAPEQDPAQLQTLQTSVREIKKWEY